MLRFLLAAGAVVAAHGASPGDETAKQFEAKLDSDQRILQALDRLTFGARPGDMDEIRKIGVEKWIDQQLHPERIAENPVLDAKLKPLESTRMDSAAILKQYYQQNRAGIIRVGVNLNTLLPGDQSRKVFNGTIEERRATIMALDPETRIKVLATIPPNLVECIPELQKEAVEARKKEMETRQAELRKQRPQLRDLLDGQQALIVRMGTPAERAALFASLDPEKLKQVAAALPPDALAGRADLRRMAAASRNPQQLPIADLREAKLYRAIYSNRQLEEVLTDFWFNHFNVFEGKGADRIVLTSYERDAIRPHVLGKFQDLLLAVAHHPAMLYYLDNWESMATGSFEVGPFAPQPPGVMGFVGGRGGPFARLPHGLNENYGRELMELHTMGVNGGYTQQDVIAVARCFTGWTIKTPAEKPEFVFAPFMHDNDEKTVLGHKIAAGGGEHDGLEVIDILAHHPSTARFISAKLARYFVADDPPPELVERLARTFTKTDGDLRAVLTALFTSREFFSQGAWQSKVRTPLQMVAASVRALDADVTDSFMLVQKVSEMGEPLYGKEAPTGYKDNAATWLSTASVMARMEFASAVVNGKTPGVNVDWSRFEHKDPTAIASVLLHRSLPKEGLDAIQAGLNGGEDTPARIAAVILSSPEFQRR
ncbi:MAG TPA: DUF1800 domain-containing protein [Bryobacteraceae bacterium]|nr:DUF1800 domain-containing protein [Bryobacteraceae bacterium]